MLSTWARMWAPFDKRLVLSAIKLPNNTIVEDPAQKIAALSKHWAPTFKNKTIDGPLALLIARKQPKVDMPDYAPPTVEDFEEYPKHAKHSATGPDGIPYACWLAAGIDGARILWRVTIATMQGRDPPN